MRERMRERRRGLHISMPGLVTGGFLDQLSAAGQQLPERPYDLPTRTAKISGTELHYFEFGEGQPVVFVHGSMGDYRTWGNQFEPFSNAYRVISYSRRYHYPNAWGGDGLDYSTGLHAADLAAFIRALDLGPVHLIGGSTGATIAALLASRNPELVRTLTMNEPDHAPWLLEIEGGQDALDAYLAVVDRPAAKLLAAGDPEGAIQHYVDGVLGRGTYESLDPGTRMVFLDNVPEFRAEFKCADIYYSAFTFADAQMIDVPSLLVQGGNSLPLFGLIAERFADCVRKIERVSIAGAPHAVHFSAPDQFSEAVRSFLDRNRER